MTPGKSSKNVYYYTASDYKSCFDRIILNYMGIPDNNKARVLGKSYGSIRSIAGLTKQVIL